VALACQFVKWVLIMLIKKDKDIIQAYLEDNSNIQGGNASGVVFPETETDIREFLKDAYKKRIPVTVSGAGTGVTGGRVPFGGYVLSIERLNRIKHINGDYISLESGVVHQDMDRQLRQRGLLFPVNPTETTSFIGGNIAVNASGSRSFYYGAVRRYVGRLKIILADGDVLNIERGAVKADSKGIFNVNLNSGGKISFQRPMYNMPEIKNAAGYYTKPGMDLIDLFIGSEGTLGVITEAKLAVVPDFKNLCAFFVFLKDEVTSFDLAEVFIKKTKVKKTFLNPIAIEYFDNNSLNLLRQEYSQIPEDAQSALYIEQDIAVDESNTLPLLMELFNSYGIKDKYILFGQGRHILDFYHKIRHTLPEKINELVKKFRYSKLNSDIAVPAGRFREMAEFYKEQFIHSGIRYFIFGHIGDCHLHTNLLPNSQEQAKQAQDIYAKIMKKAVSAGGTISAEHGAGKIKYRYIEMMYGENGIKEMARVKKALDPECILNPGNIFPKDYLAE